MVNVPDAKEHSFFDFFAAVPNESEDKEDFKYVWPNSVFIAGEFIKELPGRINVLPRPGVYRHEYYGTIIITREDNEDFVNNFNNEIYQKLIPIDAEHETQLSGAVGWYEPKSGRVEPDGSGTFGVRWEDRGRKFLEEGRFLYFSPSWFREWSDPATGQKYRNVLIGGALTNTPFFKDSSLRPLYASEFANPKEKQEEEPNTTPDPNFLLLLGDAEIPFYVEDNDGTFRLWEERDYNFKITSTTDHANSWNFILVQNKEGEKMAEEDPKVPSLEEFTQMKAELEKLKGAATVDVEEFNALKRQNADLVRAGRIQNFKEIVTGKNAGEDGAPPFMGDPIVHVEVLDLIHQTYGEEAAKADDSLFNLYIALQRGTAEQFKENSALTREVGGRGTSKATNNVNEFEERVKKRMADTKENYADAMRWVATEDPALAKAYRKQAYDTTSGDDE